MPWLGGLPPVAVREGEEGREGGREGGGRGGRGEGREGRGGRGGRERDKDRSSMFLYHKPPFSICFSLQKNSLPQYESKMGENWWIWIYGCVILTSEISSNSRLSLDSVRDTCDIVRLTFGSFRVIFPPWSALFFTTSRPASSFATSPLLCNVKRASQGHSREPNSISSWSVFRNSPL